MAEEQYEDTPTLLSTSIDEIPTIVDQAREAWATQNQAWNDKRKREFILRQLHNFKKLIEENEAEICKAVKDDLNKCKHESILGEITSILHDLVLLIRDYDDLIKARPAKKNVLSMMEDIYVKPEPYGVVLIISPWNYPFLLMGQPLVGAMAAGNAVVLKPSELSVNTSNLLMTLIPKYLDKNFYKVIAGDASIGQAVLKERYDYIMYTGSTSVGKIVMAEAAKNLTPVTLELGGKCPVIVADDANLKVAAKRIMWGKLMNTGQVCLSPDYVIMTSPAKRDEFVEYCKASVQAMLGNDPQQSPDYGRIINTRHFDRITKLMANSRGKNVLSGDSDRNQKYIAPAIYIDVNGDDALMQEEIFGPVLPIVTVNGLEEAITFVNEREKPLSLYVFTEKHSVFKRVESTTSSGGISQNSVVMIVGVPSLPFGGVGHSGMGVYHNYFSFETFSHMKPALRSGTKLEFLQKSIYPPYKESTLSQLRYMIIPSMRKRSVMKPLIMIGLAIFIAVLFKKYGVPMWLFWSTRK